MPKYWNSTKSHENFDRTCCRLIFRPSKNLFYFLNLLRNFGQGILIRSSLVAGNSDNAISVSTNSSLDTKKRTSLLLIWEYNSINLFKPYGKLRRRMSKSSMEIYKYGIGHSEYHKIVINNSRPVITSIWK